ncbi:MAG: hypothetical protein ACK5O7_02385 [Holosporales bacterium]
MRIILGVALIFGATQVFASDLREEMESSHPAPALAVPAQPTPEKPPHTEEVIKDTLHKMGDYAKEEAQTLELRAKAELYRLNAHLDEKKEKAKKKHKKAKEKLKRHKKKYL